MQAIFRCLGAAGAKQMFDKTLGTGAEFLLSFLQARKCYDVKIGQWRSVGTASLQLLCTCMLVSASRQMLYQFYLIPSPSVCLVLGTVCHCLHDAFHRRSSHCIKLLGVQVPVTVP